MACFWILWEAAITPPTAPGATRVQVPSQCPSAGQATCFLPRVRVDCFSPAGEARRLEFLILSNFPQIIIVWASLVAQVLKNPPAMQETQVQSLGWEDTLEKEMSTYSSILAWKIPQKSLVGYSPYGLRVGHDWMTKVVESRFKPRSF